MDKVKDLFDVLFIAALFWGLGFWLQRLGKKGRFPDYSVEAKGWWAWLMGVRPGRRERVYLGGALFQVWALLYLVVSLWAVWARDPTTLGSITIVFIFGWALSLLVANLIISLRNRQR